MKKTWHIIVVIIAGIIILAMLVNGIVNAKRDLTVLVGKNTSAIAEVKKLVVDGKTDTIEMINLNTGLINELTDIVSDNSNQIAANSAAIENNTSAVADLSQIVWAHGSKINRVVRLIFETAYGDNAETKQKIYTYTKDPYKHKGLWNEALLNLRQQELEKIIKISKIQEKTIIVQQKINSMKKGCFKK